MTAEIVSGAIGGFLAWAAGKAIVFFQKRERLKKYLEVTITSHIRETRDNDRWLSAFMSVTVKANSIVDGAPFYTRDLLEDLTDLREQYLIYLKKQELVRVTKCISALREIEALFEGFCASARELQAKRSLLTQETVEYLGRRARRIQALVALLPNDVSSLDKLPDDYAGRIGAETLVAPGKPNS
jgi:hypothetical protein